MAEDLIEFNRDGRIALKRGIELFLRASSPLSAVPLPDRRHP